METVGVVDGVIRLGRGEVLVGDGCPDVMVVPAGSGVPGFDGESPVQPVLEDPVDRGGLGVVDPMAAVDFLVGQMASVSLPPGPGS